ncbi:phosphopantetheine-binding [Parafrankia sp. EAN1pec]|nr:phosphopantetheine-binding [Frankia sp. EAN1pec]
MEGAPMESTQAEIAGWCREYLAGLLEVPAGTLDLDADFDRLGIDSALAVSLLTEVEDRYGVELAAEELFANPSLNAVAARLHEQRQAQRQVT